MTEKKTFKNPYHISHSSDWIEVHQLENTEIPSFIGHEDEWDMEVTFTKKVKPVEAGKWYFTGKRGEECSVYVLAIHGQMAWVTEDPDGLAGGALTAWTEQLDAIYH